MPDPEPSAAGTARSRAGRWRWWSGAAVLLLAGVLVRLHTSGAVDLHWPFVLVGVWAAAVAVLTLWPHEGPTDGEADGTTG